MANNCTAIVEVNGKDIQDDYWNLTIMSKQFVGKDASGLRWFDCNILCSHHKDISRLAGRNSSARKGLKLLITDNIDGVYEHACENNEYESEYKEDESGDQAQENEEMDADESDIEEVLVDDEYREDESENAAQEMDKGEDSDIEEILVDEREKSFKGLWALLPKLYFNNAFLWISKHMICISLRYNVLQCTIYHLQGQNDNQ